MCRNPPSSLPVLPVAECGCISAAATCLTASPCASRSWCELAANDTWAGASEPVAAYYRCLLPKLPQLSCIRLWVAGKHDLMHNLSHSVSLNSAD